VAKEIWHGKYGDLGNYYKQFMVANDEEIVVIKRKKDPFGNQQKVPDNTLSEQEQEQEQINKEQKKFEQLLKQENAVKPKDYPKEHIIIAKLRSILKDNARVKTHKNKEYGDICHKNLYKISTSGKVFQRKQQFNAKKYIVQLLVDTSGSMRDDNKCETACEAVGKIVTNLQDLVDIEVLTFNERSLKLKSHKEKKVSKKRMEAIISEIYKETCDDTYAGATLTIDGVKKALNSLSSLKHRNLTKIMVIVTDGQVNYAHYGECKDVFVKLIHKAEASGIKIVGLGISNSYINEWLPQSSIVIDDVKNILPALLTLLKNAIGRRT